MSDKRKEIRFFLPNEQDYKNYELLEKMGILEGKTVAEVFAALTAEYTKRPDLKKIWDSAIWVDQNELIERLETDYQISTNAQTLYNWRRDGLLDNLFCSDGYKGLLYKLEGIALIYPSIINRPRASRTPKPKVAATTKQEKK